MFQIVKPKTALDPYIFEGVSLGTCVEKTTFTKIYDQYSQRMFNYALWLTRNRDSSGDIVQTVFIRLWNLTKTIDSEGELEAWLYKVTRNACIDFFRKCSRNRSFRLKFSQEITLYTKEPAENRSVWNMLEFLNEKERSILYLYYRLGYTFKVVADILNLTESCVRTTSCRALAKLRKKCSKDML